MHKTARALPRRSTEAEKLMWSRLRGRRLQGIKFKRQVPIANYIVDHHRGRRWPTREPGGRGRRTDTHLGGMGVSRRPRVEQRRPRQHRRRSRSNPARASTHPLGAPSPHPLPAGERVAIGHKKRARLSRVLGLGPGWPAPGLGPARALFRPEPGGREELCSRSARGVSVRCRLGWPANRRCKRNGAHPEP